MLLLFIFNVAVAQKKLHPYIAIHATGNSDMNYIGPSFSAGADFQLKKQLLLTGYIHYFKDRFEKMHSNAGHLKGHYNSLTAAFLAQYRINKKTQRYFFGALGFAWQRIDEDYTSFYYRFNDKRRFITPAMRFGYAVPASQHHLAIEINATGPNTYTRAPFEIQETLTLLSLGTRFIF